MTDLETEVDVQRQMKVSALEAQRDLLAENGNLLNDMLENEERVKLRGKKEKRLQKEHKNLNNRRIAAMSQYNTKLRQKISVLEHNNNESEENERRLIESAYAAKAARIRSLEAEVDKQKTKEEAACKKCIQAEKERDVAKKERDTVRKRYGQLMSSCSSVFRVGFSACVVLLLLFMLNKEII